MGKLPSGLSILLILYPTVLRPVQEFGFNINHAKLACVQVDIWEAIATLCFIPIIVLSSYCAEKGWLDWLFCQSSGQKVMDATQLEFGKQRNKDTDMFKGDETLTSEVFKCILLRRNCLIQTKKRLML